MKTKLNKRILSAVLAFVLFVSNFPVVGFASSGFSITYEGSGAAHVQINTREKVAVTAENLPADCSYQWQILVPGTDFWVDIQGACESSLYLTYALLGSLLDSANVANVRCVAMSAGRAVEYTDILSVSVVEAPIPEPASKEKQSTEPTEATTVPTEAVTETETSEVTEASEETTAPTEAVTETETSEATEVPEETTAPTEEATETETSKATEVPEETTAPTEEATETETSEATEVPEETTAPTEAVTETETKAETETETSEATEETKETTAPTEVPAETTAPTEAVTAAEEPTDVDEKSSGASGSASGANTDIVCVTIEYHYWNRHEDEEGNQTWSPYVAYIAKNDPLHVSVPNKVIPGYVVRWADTNPAGAELITGANGESSVNVSLDSVTKNVTFKVYYDEIMVPYFANYYLQNVYNDLYTETTGILTTEQINNMKGYANDYPDPNLIYPPITGFTSLFYQPDVIAADGSTVFEVYYDRNYYLMQFDMDGGYGTAPVYARYETAFNVSAPTKAGYKFLRWELDKVNGVDATPEQKAEPFPTRIPVENRTYKAIWEEKTVPYTASYWLVDSDGKETYIGSVQKSGPAGTTAVGQNDLADGTPVCGYTDHVHTDDCCTTCGHLHTDACYDGLETGHSPSAEDRQAFADIGAGEPKSGYVYVIKATGDGNYYYYFPVGDSWYYITNASSYISGDVLGEGTYSNGSKTWTAKKYNANLKCGIVHNDTHVLNCPTSDHTHNPRCYSNPRNMAFISATSAEIKGDGSTVVNSYYRYKEYTLKFYYAATTGGTATDTDGDASTYDSVKIVGGSTTYFGRSSGTNTDVDVTQLDKMYSKDTEWGEVTELPTLNQTGLNRNYDTGSEVSGNVTYHYISFKAKYGDDISEKWPFGVFNNVTRKKENTKSSWSGTTAFVGGWNGEHHVQYSLNSNETIKGNYEKLDAALLFAPNYTDSTEVSYLCFWSNGADITWSVPELYVCNIWFPCLDNNPEKAPIDPQTNTKKTTEQRGPESKWYYLETSFKNVDDSNIKEQTPPSYAGYTYDYSEWGTYFISSAFLSGTGTDEYAGQGADVSKVRYNKTTETLTSGGMQTQQQLTIDEDGKDSQNNQLYFMYSDKYNSTNPPEGVDKDMYREAYYRDYYYMQTPHKLYFWNYNDHLMSGEGSDVAYGTSLAKHGPYAANLANQPEHYPTGLESGVYHFVAWYKTSNFVPGTEVDWENETMPDSSFTVYAKWEPITYDTYFYIDYEHLLADQPFQNVQDTPHGTSMKTDGLTLKPTHHEYTDYKFVNWFYIDAEGNKKAFEPAEMAVRQDLKLYAEWVSTIPVKYTVHYVKGNENGDIVDKNGNILNTDGYILDEEGNPTAEKSQFIKLGEDVTGYGFEGTTRTFKAKTKDELTMLDNLTTEEQTRMLLPHTNSHSILLKKNAAENEFFFVYMSREEAPYTVRYVDASSGNSVHQVFENEHNSNAVVTEQFAYVPGYIPDAFYKTLILSANELENVITFTYTKDEDAVEDEDGNIINGNAIYYIAHYTEGINGADYIERQPDSPTGKIGTEVTVEALTFDGFVFDEEKTKEVMGDAAVQQVDGKWTVKGTITSGAEGQTPLQIRLYYSRREYPYTVEYLERGTNKVLINESNVSNYPGTVLGGKDDYQKVIHLVAPEIPGYELYSTSPSDLKISYDENLNKVTFYYTKIPVTIHYHAMLRNAKAVSFGKVSRTSEAPQDQAMVSGAQAMEDPGFRFVGWYSDEACQNPITDPNWFLTAAKKHIKPQINFMDDVYVYNYYALFEPITLKIVQYGMKYETDSGIYQIINSDDAVVATVVITGTGEDNAVILEQIPAGNYRIREIGSDWTWTYEDTTEISFAVLNTGNNVVEVTHTSKTVDWLHNEKDHR